MTEQAIFQNQKDNTNITLEDKNSNLKRLHNQLIIDNYAVPEDFENFKDFYSDRNNAKRLQSQLIQDNYAIPKDLDVFMDFYGFKKKELTDYYGLPSKETFKEVISNYVEKEQPPYTAPTEDKKLSDFSKNFPLLEKPNLTLRKPELKGYPQTTFIQALYNNMDRSISEEKYKQYAQERISEIDKQLKELPGPTKEQMMEFATGQLPVTSINPEKQKLIKEKEILQFGITQPDKIQWFFGSAYARSIFGLANKVIDKEHGIAMQEWLDKYDPNTLTDIAASTLGFMIDLPIFSGLGSVGVKIGKEAAQPIVKRVMNNAVKKWTEAGFEKEIAEKFIQRGAERLTDLIPRITSSSAALGGYDAINDILGQWARPNVSFKDIDFSQSLKKGMTSATLGGIVGSVGAGASLLANKARAIPNAIERITAQVGIGASELTANSAIFALGTSLSEHEKITLNDFLTTAGQLAALKMATPLTTAKKIYKSMRFEPNTIGKGIYEVEIEPWEIRDLNGKDYDSFLKELSTNDNRLIEILKEPNTPALLKQKLLWGSRGIGVDNVNFAADEIKLNKNFIEYYNDKGLLLDRKRYVNEEEAKKEIINEGMRLEDNKFKKQMTDLSEEDKIELNNKLLDKGIDSLVLLRALEKDVVERTPKENKLIGNLKKLVSEISKESEKKIKPEITEEVRAEGVKPEIKPEEAAKAGEIKAEVKPEEGKPEVKPQAEKIVSKEIEPLVEEAKKYKDVKEFIEYVKPENITDLRPEKIWGKAIPTTKKDINSDSFLPLKNFYEKYSDAIKNTKIASYLKDLPKKNTITVYAGVPEGVNEIRIGDRITFDPDYAKNYIKEKGWKLLKKEVPVEDVIWKGEDWNEFVYSPDKIRNEVGSLEDFYNRMVKGVTEEVRTGVVAEKISPEEIKPEEIKTEEIGAKTKPEIKPEEIKKGAEIKVPVEARREGERVPEEKKKLTITKDELDKISVEDEVAKGRRIKEKCIKVPKGGYI